MAHQSPRRARRHRSDEMNELTDKQKRMLAAGVFHFDSGGDNRDNLMQARDLERRGLITIRENVYDQFSVFQCEAIGATGTRGKE